MGSVKVVTDMDIYKFRTKMFFQLHLSMLMLCVVCAEAEAYVTTPKMHNLCYEFNALNTKIRDNKINRPTAKEQFRRLIEAIKKEYFVSGGGENNTGESVFPLQGYGYKAIGGVNGNGYQKGGYNYFDGDLHTGHPSQDIFIRDKKHVSLDDVTRKPVGVLSLSAGIVVAAETDWDSSSSLRGGKYIWIYAPTSNALVYYAHNSKLYVEVGDFVNSGDIISEVGRTGLNAYKRRSPTHLHLTYLSIVNGLPVPKNIFELLLDSKLR